MMTKRQLIWNYLFLIITVLPCCWGMQVSIEQREYEVASGGDITLTCSFVPAKPDITTLILKWDVDPVNIDEPLKPVATYFLNNPVNIAPGYEGRATLEVDLIQRVSKLHLKQVTVSDSRRFQCSVVILDDDEGTTAASTSLLVLVPPSVPLCRLQGRAEYWQDISLTCVSEDGSPKPTYVWKSYSVQNIPRSFPPKTTEKDGVLSLFNISRETSGFFVCTSTNRIGSNNCNFTLAVVPGGMNEANMGAIIGGVIACVVVLGIIIFVCCRRRNKKAKYAEGAAGQVQFYEKDAPEVEEQLSQSMTKQGTQNENQDSPKSGHKFDDDQQSNSSSKDRVGGKGGDTNSQHYRDDQRDQYRRSRDHLDEQRDRYGGSRDRLDEQSDRYHGNRVEEKHNHYRGSRDRLDDQRDNYRSSRDRLDDPRDNYRGSRDRLDDQRNYYRGSRDQLDDKSDRYGGYRDPYDDQRDRYRGSRDRLNYRDDEYRD